MVGLPKRLLLSVCSRCSWLALCTVLPVAAVASGVDGAGPALPPAEGRVDDPLIGLSGRSPGAGQGAASLDLGLAYNPLVASIFDEDGQRLSRSIIGRALSTRVGGIAGLTDRVAVGATLPVFLHVAGEDVRDLSSRGGPALGDAQLWVPVQAVGSAQEPFALTLAPFLSLPTGSAGRFLGTPGLGGGALAIGSARIDALTVTGGLGAEVRGGRQIEHFHQGSRALGHLGLTYAVRPRLALHAEARGAWGLRSSTDERIPSATQGAGRPVEAQLGLRAQLSDQLLLHAGAGTALSGGVGAARLRLGAGLTVPWGQAAPAREGVVEAETPTLQVVDERGAPLHGVWVRSGDVLLGRTDPQGRIDLIDRKLRRDLTFELHGYEPFKIDRHRPDLLTIALAPEPINLTLRAADPEGQALPATAMLRERDGAEQRVDLSRGSREVDLLPGTWTLRVEAEGRGAQERTLELDHGQAPIRIEALLREREGDETLALTVVDPEGRSVRDLAITVDGLPVGTASEGSDLRIEGLSQATHAVRVQAQGHLAARRDVVSLDEGTTPTEIVLAPEPGSVTLQVRAPDGPVSDATARWAGPTRLSQELGPRGERSFVLRPGEWTLVVSSPTYGLQQRTVQIVPDLAENQTIEVVLQPPEGGEADLALRVVDARGEPLAGAEVLLDLKALGTTTTGGVLRLGELSVGPRELAIGGHLLRPTRQELSLIAGLNEHTVVVPYLPGATRVRAQSPDSPVTDALARFAGPESPEPLPLGRRGSADTVLSPGDWGVVVSSPTFGLQQRDLTVQADSGQLQLVDVHYGTPPDGGQAELWLSIRDPEGQPVEGAVVALDGASLGQTGSGGSLRVPNLATGRRTLSVSAPLFAPKSETFFLRRGGTERELSLGWGDHAVLVRVLDAEGSGLSNALVRFAGPRFVDALPVDREGVVLTSLEPGEWFAVASSADHGLTQRELVVEPGAGLTELELELGPPNTTLARVLIRARGPGGLPIPNARFSLGEEVRDIEHSGTTLIEVVPGTYTLRVEAPGFVSGGLTLSDLPAGDHERIIELDYAPISVEISLHDAQASPVAGRLSFDGPTDLAPRTIGAGGKATVELTPGRWTVLAESTELGAGSQRLDLELGQRSAKVGLTLRPREVDLVDGALELRQVIGFAFNKAEIDPSASPLLDEVAATLIAHPELRKIAIEGHSDAVGGVAYNLTLSERRAEAVRAALVERGVAPERLISRGYGPTRPLVEGDSDEARAANRRVAFSVLE